MGIKKIRDLRGTLAHKDRYWHKAFFYAMLLSGIIFSVFMIYDRGYFLYYGDFNVQQVPFYQMIHDSLRAGNWKWSWTTDLGANIIGSYSFYLITSPFFLLTLPFPSAAVPYMMGPLLVLKFSFASLTAYIYLKRYVIDKNFAVIGGILYAFSGYSVYNVFFNHFHEAIVFFPLLLAAVDAFMLDKRRGLLGLAVFCCCTVNYYFFVGQVTFVIIYWVIRMLSGSYGITIKEFLVMAFEVVVGFLMSAFVLLPTILAVIQNPRIDNGPNGWYALLYSSEQRYLHIIQSLFFPPDIPARPNFTPDSNAKWASLGAWLPMFSMAGVVAFVKSRRSKWLKKLLFVLLFMAFVPVLNSAFQMFNASYYARWFYMLTLMTTLATVTSLDRQSVDWKYAIKFTAAVTMGIIIAIGFMPKKETVDGVETTVYGLMKYRDRFWIYAAIAMVSLALLTYVIYLLKKDRKKFLRICSLCLSCVILVYSIYIITLGKTQSYSTHEFIIPYVINGGDRLELDDIQEVRSDFYETMDNLGMFWQIPTIQAFHSVVPGSVMQFYPSVGVTRDVGSRPEVKYFGLRSFLSVKYLFDYSGKGDDGNFKNYDGTTKMPGYVYYDNQNSYDIWENLYYIPYGFTFDYYMTESQFMECPEDTRHLLLLKALVVPDEDEGKYDGIMKQADSYSDFTYTDSQYFKDCEERREVACNYFEHDNDGFSAKIDLTESKSRLVFFSVPYEDGWTAYVNGVETEIQTSSIGFMSVLCEGGKSSDIRFVYNVPGLKAGAAVTLVCIVLYGAYLVIIIKRGKIKKNTKKYRVVSADINSDIALTSKKINGILQNTQSVRTEINRQNRAENGEITFENQTEQNTEQQLGNTELNQNAADAQNKIGFDNSEDGLTEKKVSDNINTNTDVGTVQTDVLNNERQNGTSDNKTDE